MSVENTKENLVTLIISAYNAEKTINRAIVSALRQTYKDLEIIIINDCSEDNTLNIAKQYISDKVRVFDSSKNSGAYFCRNYGISMSKGRYITFLDADDWIDSNHIEILHESYLKFKNKDYYKGTTISNPKNKLKMVFSSARFMKEASEGSDKFEEVVIDFRVLKEPIKAGPYAGSARFHRIEASCFFEKSLLEEFGSFDCARFGADSEFLQRVSIEYGPVEAWLPKSRVTYNVRVSDSSLTRDPKTGMKSAPRSFYYNTWREWHRKIKVLKETLSKDMQKDILSLYVPFPQKKRVFEVSKYAETILSGNNSLDTFNEIFK